MSNEEIKFDCPECGEGLAIDRRAIGHQVACPFCKVSITVPEVGDRAVPLAGGLEDEPQAGKSLEELASSRPEPPKDPAGSKPTGSGLPRASAAAAAAEEQAPAAPAHSGGLPPRRKPGEKPRAMAEDPRTDLSTAAMPADRAAPPIPPPARTNVPRDQGAPAVAESGVAAGRSRAARSNETGSEVPAGYEEKVRRKRKRRNPDEHRLNPREHPKMVAFDEVVGDNTFRKHPGRGKMPLLKKLGLMLVILGILAAIGLGVLKQMELNEPDASSAPEELQGIDREFLDASERLDAFREAGSIADKMSFVRVPVTNMEGYPPLMDRMNEFYTKNTLNPHFPRLDRASTELINQGEAEFLRISMENKGVNTFLYFEKSAAGYQLDWDSFVGYNPVSWTEFLVNPSGDSESGVFRLIVTRKDHYTGLFQDEGKYRSYSVTDLNASLKAIAYVVRETPNEEVIEGLFSKLLMRDDQQVLVIAQVNLVERGVDGSHLIQIDKVLRDSWLLP